MISKQKQASEVIFINFNIADEAKEKVPLLKTWR